MTCYRIFNFVSRIFIEGMYVVALLLTIITIIDSIFHPLLVIFFNKWLVFFQFCSYCFWKKSIIAVYEFNELYFEIIIKVYWWIRV